jgi:protein-S-isoprenylcysteine O-methyltransferase Ste14
MTWASINLPTWIRWLGAVLGLMTIPAAAWVLGSLGQNVSETVLTKQVHRLVTVGPYRLVRHPLYSTGLTLFFALGLILSSWFVLFMSVVAVSLILCVIIPAEERALLEKFGDHYQQLMRATGRLIPHFSTAAPPSAK